MPLLSGPYKKAQTHSGTHAQAVKSWWLVDTTFSSPCCWSLILFSEAPEKNRPTVVPGDRSEPGTRLWIHTNTRRAKWRPGVALGQLHQCPTGLIILTQTFSCILMCFVMSFFFFFLLTEKHLVLVPKLLYHLGQCLCVFVGGTVVSQCLAFCSASRPGQCVGCPFKWR